MADLLRDLRLALRSLGKRPGLTVIATLTLALGVGANTAIFSVVHGVLLRPLGFAQEQSLVAVVASHQAEGSQRPGSSIDDYWFYQDHQTSFESLSYYGWSSMTLEETGRVQQLAGVYIDPELFQTLGVEPAFGRGLRLEDAPGGVGNAALISHGLWHRLWGGRDDALGQVMRLDGRSITIAGIMPEQTAMPSRHAEIWVPAGRFEKAEGRFNRDERDFLIVGRLAEGVSLDQAEDEMQQLAGQLAEDFPVTNGAWGVRAISLRDHLVGASRQPILIAFAAVSLVLLLACANISHLLLVRSTGRQREMSVRAALGAGRGHLARLVMIESLLLALLGGVAGTLTAAWLHDVLLSLDPGILPRADLIALDAPVMFFALGASILTGLICGIAPALHSSATLFSALREGGRGSVGTGSRGTGAWLNSDWRPALLSFEVALALLLLTSAGWLIRALNQMDSVNPGFSPGNTYSSHFILDGSAYDDPQARILYFQQLHERVSALPGIEAAALTTTPPVPNTGITIDVPYRIAGDPPFDQQTGRRAAFRVVTPGYFEAMEIPLLAGRDLTSLDRQGQIPAVIINRNLARRLGDESSVVGSRLQIEFGGTSELEIIGVVGDTRFAGLHTAPRPALFLAHAQMPFRGMAVVARTSLAPAVYEESLRHLALGLDSVVPPGQLFDLEQRLESSVGLERFFATLLGLFATLAVLLAAAGIFGVFSYWVSQRTREIGLRMALGAESRQVIAMVIHQGLQVACYGLLAGGCGTFLIRDLLSHSFKGVDTDISSVLAVAALLAFVTLASCLLPAWRASRIEPTAALRAD